MGTEGIGAALQNWQVLVWVWTSLFSLRKGLADARSAASNGREKPEASCHAGTIVARTRVLGWYYMSY